MNQFGKLIGIEREIWVYRNSGEELIEEVQVDVSVDELKEILFPYEHDDDPLFYHEYNLNIKQLNFLINRCKLSIIPDFELYDYILVAHGIYQKE